ncbi:MAG: ROK family transcriptional regulator [Microbacterium sp.]|nr:ROK family transcriptional regulator [Microbacterium sp.]
MVKSGTPQHLRTLNEGAIVDALIRLGPLTRPEIEEATGLSKAAAARLLLRVEEAGVVVRDGERQGRSGPPAQVWRVNPRAAIVAGVTVSVEELSAETHDLDGTLLGSASVPNDVAAADDIVPALLALLDAAAAASGASRGEVRDITIGFPGIIDPLSGVLRHSRRLPAWVDVDVIGELAAALPGTEIYTANDVGLVLIAEAEYGAASEASPVALLWIGSGTKAAYLRDGELMIGPHGSAGEIGAMIMPAFGMEPTAALDGRTPVPGGGVLVEQLLGAEALLRLDGDVGAIADRVAAVASPVISMLDPELVVIAGALSDEYGERLAAAVQESLAFLPHERPDVRAARLGSRAQILGAVCLSQRSARARLVDVGSSAEVVLSLSAG